VALSYHSSHALFVQWSAQLSQDFSFDQESIKESLPSQYGSPLHNSLLFRITLGLLSSIYSFQPID